MGSDPSFNPNRFTNALSERELDEIEQVGVGAKSGEPEPAPLVDRATEGAYPTGSTFKPITAIGSLEAGVLNPYEDLGGGSASRLAPSSSATRAKTTTARCRPGRSAQGLLRHLLLHGRRDGQRPRRSDPAHGARTGHWAPTGIDLPNESEGTVPSPKWLEERNALETKCTREHHGHSCEIVAEPGAPWSVGHNMDLAVGQGDLQTDPLQMAVAYSTLANAFMNNGEGWVPTPAPRGGDRKPQRGDRADAEISATAQAQTQPRQPGPRDGRDP